MATPDHDWPGSAYDLIATEYYAGTHLTSRNFDAATREYFRGGGMPTTPPGPVLELGAGRGRVGEYLGVHSESIIQTDASAKMLALADREPSFVRVLCDGRTTPFWDDQFSIVAGFLFDAFSGPEVFGEAYRVLQDGGCFVGTLPDATWGRTLRRKIGVPLDSTRFLLATGDTVRMPSVLWDDEELTAQAVSAGFQEISIRHLRTPLAEQRVSADIRIAADELGVGTHEIDLVQLVIARK